MSSLSVRVISRIEETIKKNFQKSKTRELSLLILSFLENSFIKSKVRKTSFLFVMFYPGRFWSKIDKLNKRFNLEFFLDPFILFPLVYIGFVGISTYRPSFLATFSILIGLISFMFGVKIARKSEFGVTALENYSSRLAISLLVIGVFALVLDIERAGAVPLFEPFAKKGLSVSYTMLASLIVPGGILAISVIGVKLRNGEIGLREARVYALLTLLTTTMLISLVGFRTQIIVSILGCSMAMYFSRILGWIEIVSFFMVSLFGISFFGYLRAVEEGAGIGILEVLGRRVGLTLSIYDTLVNLYWPFGVNRGSVALATFSSYFSFIPGPSLGPRTIVARMFGVYDISMTSTLFGTVMLDFGIIGIMVFALILGLIIGAAYKATLQTHSAIAISILSLLFAYVLVGIETGLVDFNVFMFFFIGALIILKSRIPRHY